MLSYIICAYIYRACYGYTYLILRTSQYRVTGKRIVIFYTLQRMAYMTRLFLGQYNSVIDIIKLGPQRHL